MLGRGDAFIVPVAFAVPEDAARHRGDSPDAVAV
jgi:hypothetical protein